MIHLTQRDFDAFLRETEGVHQFTKYPDKLINRYQMHMLLWAFMRKRSILEHGGFQVYWIERFLIWVRVPYTIDHNHLGYVGIREVI